MNLRFLLKQEGKCNWRELMQQAQDIEENIHESNVDLLKFPIHFPKHQEKDLKEKSYQICENFSTSNYVP
jgi:hypothetical protein